SESLRAMVGADPKTAPVWVVFWTPALLLAVIGVVLFFLLRDRPSEAGHADFDTGDADEGSAQTRIPMRELLRKIFTNRILLTIAAIEFCTGVVRQGIMQWFPIYTKEVWVLPTAHGLVGGAFSWKLALAWIAAAFVLGAARMVDDKRRAFVITA